MPSIALELVLVFVLLVINGLFALAEIALVSAKPVRLQQRAELGDAGAAAALELARDPTRFLSTVQIGITLVGILAGAFGGATLAEAIGAAVARVPVLAPYGEAIGLTVVVIGLTYFSLVIGELAPKRLALTQPELIAARLAKPIGLLARAAGPLVRLLSVSTELLLRLLRVPPTPEAPLTADEITRLVAQGATTGAFEPAEHEIVASALQLDERRVTSRMTPRTQVEWLNLEDPLDALRRQVSASPHTYFPVAAGDLDQVRGVLRGRDLLARLLDDPQRDWADLLRPAVFVPEAQTVLDVLQALKSSGAPLALIIDEYGGLHGLVTLTDMLEALVGDIAVPGLDAAAAAVRRTDGSWLLDGRLPIDTLAVSLGLRGLPAAPADYDTLGGFVMDQLGQVPAVGQRFDYAGWRFEVVDMDGRRVDRVLAAQLPPASSE